VGICFVLLLVRGTRKWVAVIYLHSKLKLSLHKIPQYLPGAGSREPGAGSREPGAGSREQGAGSREPGTECLLRIGPLVIGAGCWKLVFFSTRRRVRLKMRWLADVDKLDNSPGHRARGTERFRPGLLDSGVVRRNQFFEVPFPTVWRGQGKASLRSEADFFLPPIIRIPRSRHKTANFLGAWWLGRPSVSTFVTLVFCTMLDKFGG
jgi:hypothetical protein